MTFYGQKMLIYKDSLS